VKAQELRIGNCIYNKFHKDIEIVDHSTIRYIEIGEHNDYAPIPLTRKRLKDFGFKRSLHTYWFIGSFGGDYYTGGIFELTHYELAPIKYVHQLQNLYFALTGEEITSLSDNDSGK